MTINHDKLCETMRRALVGGQCGAIRNGIRYIEDSVRDLRITAEDGVEFLRSVRFDWSRIPDGITLVRYPNPQYWALRQELVRATLRIAEERRWDAAQNRKPPLWNQCSLGEPEALPRSQRPCHAFTFVKMRRGPGWTPADATRELHRAIRNRYHDGGGVCALLAEEIAEIASGEEVHNEQCVQDAQAIVITARDHCTQRANHSGMWMPSFQRYRGWWEQLFDVALYKITRNTKGA